MLSVALSTATWGCARIAAHLSRTWQVRIAPSTVPRLLRRVGLATPARAPDCARAAGGAHRGPADRADAAAVLTGAPWPHAACARERTRGNRSAWTPSTSTTSKAWADLAHHGLRRGQPVRDGHGHGLPHHGRRRRPARLPGPSVRRCGLAPASRTYRRRPRVQGCLR